MSHLHRAAAHRSTRPAVAVLALLLVVALAGVPGAPVGAQDDPPEGATRIPLAEFTPLPAVEDAGVDPETRLLRDELLGPTWDDPDLVTLHWFGVSAFVLSYRGHVLLLDAWEIIGANNDYAPIGREELAALQPEAVLLGHGHFDHAGDIGYVSVHSDAVIVGSEEICDEAITLAEQEGGTAADVTCAITGTMETPAPGTAQTLDLFADTDPVTVLQHIHSAATAPGEDNPPNPQLPIFDPTPYLEYFADDPEELARFIRQQQASDQGGTWMYHFVADEFTLLWGNSSGPIFTDPAVGEALGSFPGCVDVMSNAILGFDQPVSGLQDPRLYVDAVQPKVYLPQHGDAWVPVISAGQEQYIPTWRAENEALGIGQPATRFLLDPADYMVPQVFDTRDPRWADETPGSTCATQRIDRRWGADRTATAARLSETRFAPGQDQVWVVPADSFTEAVVAAPAAGRAAGPVLLHRDDALPTATLEALQRLRPAEVVVLNPGAGLVDALAAVDGVGAVTTIAEEDPYAMSAAVAATFGGAAMAYLTTGEAFPDALAAGPAAILEGAPVLLTRPDALPEATLQALRDLDTADPLTDLRVVIVGGTAAVSSTVADALGEEFTVERVDGTTRFGTAAALAALEVFGAAPTVFVANGLNFPDALTAGVPAGLDGSPILLVTRDDVPTPTAAAIGAASSARWAVVAGGDAVVGPDVRQAVSDLLPDLDEGGR